MSINNYLWWQQVHKIICRYNLQHFVMQCVIFIISVQLATVVLLEYSEHLEECSTLHEFDIRQKFFGVILKINIYIYIYFVFYVIFFQSQKMQLLTCIVNTIDNPLETV